MDSVRALRAKIDMLDQKIVATLAQRFTVVRIIGVAKKKNDLPVLDRTREKRLLARITRLGARHGVRAHFLRRVFTCILEESRRIQHRP